MGKEAEVYNVTRVQTAICAACEHKARLLPSTNLHPNLWEQIPSCLIQFSGMIQYDNSEIQVYMHCTDLNIQYETL